MLTEESTLNDILGVSSAPDDSTTDASTAQGHDGGVSSDVTLNTQGAGSEDTGSNDGEPDDQKDAAGDDKGGEPYHKDPLNQRLLKERNEARERAARLEGRLEALEAQAKAKTDQDDPTGGLGYIDISEKSEDELIEWQARDPKGYAANLLAQAKAEVYGEIKSDTTKEAAKTEREAVRRAYEGYVEKNPDFKDMWEAGEIQEFMRKNPGHTAMSAHMAMTEETRIEKAIKAKEKEIEKNLLAKRRAGGGLGVSGGGPRGRMPVEDPAMKDTKAGGGFVTVMANKLRLMRQNST